MHLNTCGQQSGLWLPISRPTLRMASMHKTWAVCSHTPCTFPICSSFCSTFSFTVCQRDIYENSSRARETDRGEGRMGMKGRVVMRGQRGARHFAGCERCRSSRCPWFTCKLLGGQVPIHRRPLLCGSNVRGILSEAPFLPAHPRAWGRHSSVGGFHVPTPAIHLCLDPRPPGCARIHNIQEFSAVRKSL